MISQITKAKKELKEALERIDKDRAKIEEQTQDLKNATKQVRRRESGMPNTTYSGRSNVAATSILQRSNVTQQLRSASATLKETQAALAETERKRAKGSEILRAYKKSEEDRHKKHLAKEAQLQASFMTAKSGLKFTSAVKEKQICKVLQRCLIRVRMSRDEAKRAAGSSVASPKGPPPTARSSPSASGDNDGNDDGSHKAKR